MTEQELELLIFPIGIIYVTLAWGDDITPEEKGFPGKWEFRGETFMEKIWQRVE